MNRLIQLDDTPPVVTPPALVVPTLLNEYDWQPWSTVEHKGPGHEIDIFVPHLDLVSGWPDNYPRGAVWYHCFYTNTAADPAHRGWWGLVRSKVGGENWRMVQGEPSHWRRPLLPGMEGSVTSPRPEPEMRLWRISQSVNVQYDTYDSAVVAAPTHAVATHMIPAWKDTGAEIRLEGGLPVAYLHGKQLLTYGQEWVEPGDVSTRLLGPAEPGTPISVICASFNAG